MVFRKDGLLYPFLYQATGGVTGNGWQKDLSTIHHCPWPSGTSFSRLWLVEGEMRGRSPWLKASSSLNFSLLQGGDLACQLPNYPLRYVEHHPDPVHPS